MTLVNRVSAFFLAALALILIVYSGVFYFFVRGRLVQQFDQELHGALYSLVAAIEVEPEEVKWQPLEHAIDLGAVRGPDEVQWAVIGDTTRVVEQSRDAAPEFLAQAKAIAASASQRTADMPISAGGDWHLLHQRVAAPSPEYSEREPDEFDEITVVVAHDAALVELADVVVRLDGGAVTSVERRTERRRAFAEDVPITTTIHHQQ